jgi:uncharacterized membrane protein YfcA
VRTTGSAGVDWALVRRMSPGMAIGTLLATALSGWVPQRLLALAFVLIVYVGATQILLGRKPKAGRTLPGTPALGAALGVPVAVIGMLGFVFSGLQVPGLPSVAGDRHAAGCRSRSC